MRDMEIRRATADDANAVASIRHRAGVGGPNILKERFLVAEERGQVLAVARYRKARGGLMLDRAVADPQVEEYRFAVLLYGGAGELARTLERRLVWVECDTHREYLLESGYVRRVGGWRLDVDWEMSSPRLVPEWLWRRMLAFWRATDAPLFRASWF
ncbi:hypothetical protein [Rubrobacter aplysinae]|uniref:hypothetical protein n=1 Tax=Rubrobacter aplysinae TaxID=909625 RepID=UPI00064BD2F6|nr:hypothetical protein [Rubrobacter aplysinae]